MVNIFDLGSPCRTVVHYTIIIYAFSLVFIDFYYYIFATFRFIPEYVAYYRAGKARENTDKIMSLSELNSEAAILSTRLPECCICY